MALILGIETSCDETGAAVFDTAAQKILSYALFSQIMYHEKYGGVVPEIASRSQLERIDIIIAEALAQANITVHDLDALAVTNTPGLAGSLLVGICFAKGMAWAANKKIIGINHLEGHVFSPFLKADNSVEQNIPFPHLSLTASGGHTALYLVKGFGDYVQLCNTLDDAAGEAFDKISHLLNLGYPGGPIIEKLAQEVHFEDFFKYPRTKNKNSELMFSFSGLKTAILYNLVNQGAYNLQTGPIKEKITPELQKQVASSLLVCVADIFEKNLKLALQQYPTIKAVTFGGGVACNKFITQRFRTFCERRKLAFFSPPPKFCTDNGGMIAFVGGYKYHQEKFSDLHLDVHRS